MQTECALLLCFACCKLLQAPACSDKKIAITDIEDLAEPKQPKSHWVDLPPDQDETLQRLLKLRGLRGIDKLDRHLFLCSLDGEGNCCSANEAGKLSWDHLKKRLKQLKLDVPREDQSGGVIYRCD